MDNLTHSLVGGALARSGLERASPLATTTLVLAANAPDVDIVAYAWGPYHALALRRGITHGVPAMVVLPFLLVGLVLAWDRWVRRRTRTGAPPARPLPLLFVAAIGVVTHPALDWLNTYGMRWWLPFSDHWSYGDALFIVDPWLWLLLGGSLFLTGSRSPGARIGWGALALVTSGLVFSGPIPPVGRIVWVLALAGLIGLRIRRGRDLGRATVDLAGGTRLNRRVGALTVAYILSMIALSDRTGTAAGATLTEVFGQVPDEVMVAPLPARPLASEVLALVGDEFIRGDHAWLDSDGLTIRDGDALPTRSVQAGIPEADAGSAIQAAQSDPEVRAFLVWSRYPVYSVRSESGGFRVFVGDARYEGAGVGSLEGLSVLVGDDFRLIGRAP